MKSLGSDNHSGIHPNVLEAIQKANVDHALSYGLDPLTKRYQDLIKSEFGEEAVGYPVFSGTGSNVLALSLALRPYEAVVCSELAHIHSSETGAPERFLGSKLLLVPIQFGAQGKITLEGLLQFWKELGNPHHVQPKIVSISQGTEVGTVYTPSEIR